MPQLYVVVPKEALGGLLTFAGADRKIALGEAAAERFVASLGQTSGPGCTADLPTGGR